MTHLPSRREILALSLAAGAACVIRAPLAATAADAAPPAEPHTLTLISGSPAERGRMYGEKFKEGIARFFEREIDAPFAAAGKQTRDEMRRYAAACGKELAAYVPTIMAEIEGVAAGSGLAVEDVLLINCHEELWHRGVLPPVPHCTAVAAGPPDTRDGRSYVGQTWDWMPSVYGLSSMLHWKRPAAEGPSVLAYSYPGLWVGAGLNSAGLALCWTSGPDEGSPGPRVGIPSYALLTHLLYQPTLAAAIDEAKRATHAGWFTFVMADGEGNIANIEGSPRASAIETTRGRLARAYFGTREMTGTKEGEPVQLHPRCQHMTDLLDASAGKLDRPTLQRLFATHGGEGKEAICVHPNTLDAMLFDCTAKEAHIARGPACTGKWQRFSFDDPEPAANAGTDARTEN